MEFSQIALGVSHTCAVTPEHEVYCWGANDQGQLGLGIVSEEQVPVPNPVGGGREYAFVSVCAAHSCALTISRGAYCWGYGSSVQLGTGQAGTFPRPSPDSVIGDLSFDVISAGSAHTCGVTTNSDAFCWGLGQDGRLGVGSTANEVAPTSVVSDLKFSHISAGVTHTCALALDGLAYCWGDGASGQLGTGGLGGSDVPVPVVGGLLFESISAGGGFSCGVTSAGDAYCWGRNETGQLGDGTFEARVQPTAVAGGLAFQTVSAGFGTFGTVACGLTLDRLVYCWGDGQRGQTGTGDQIVVNSPARVYGQAG